MTDDAKKLARTAQRLVVERLVGSAWEPLWGAAVDRVEINPGASPSSATIWFPEMRWEADNGLHYGDRVRIRTDWPEASGQATVFSGFVVNELSEFSGGDEKGGAFERNAVVCLDHRWLMSVTSPVFGQYARGLDDWTHYGETGQQPLGTFRFFSGRRCIFNEDGKPNRDIAHHYYREGSDLLTLHFFDDPGGELAGPWSVLHMVTYLMNPNINKAYSYMNYGDSALLPGMDAVEFLRVLNHVVIDGLNVLQALEHICKQIGFSFRETYLSDGKVTLSFYKIGHQTGYNRGLDPNRTIMHRLHAPAVGESIATAIAEGKKMLWAMDIAQDISGLVNNPWGIGSPDRVEFTAELAPGWVDADLEPDTSVLTNIFKTEADLVSETNPDLFPYYCLYHSRGSSFRRDVGRKWVLNETGTYTQEPYDRGGPFDFSTIDAAGEIYDAQGRPTKCLKDADGKRNFGPFRRKLLPCLTVDKDEVNSAGIVVEFSLDYGITWQKMECSIEALEDEAGIYIAEPNLAEMIDKWKGTVEVISGQPIEKNFWTSLCDDVVNDRAFKDGEWRTRIRVTASVQMDQRLRRQEPPSGASGSPFIHSRLYDFSEKYGLAKRASTSKFTGGILGAAEQDDSEWFGYHLADIRRACEDASISGKFTLERLWLGDGSGLPDFMPGDCIERITGREYSLAAALNGDPVYPEIVKIVYLPDRQQMMLITRDLRYADVVLG